MRDLSEIILNEFPKKKILIVGDLVADQFLRGKIARVSREAPVFILRHEDTETTGGAAANAAVNTSSLGATPILIGVMGRDENGSLLRQALEASKVDCSLTIADPSFSTTTKVRVLAGQHYAPRQQVIRIDYENKGPIASETLKFISDRIPRAAKEADAIILSDYNYGVACPEIALVCLNAARENNIPLVVDSRFRLTEFANATSATPNQEEVEQILGSGFSDDQCEQLRQKLGYESLVVTCGNEGMLIVESGQEPVRIDVVGSKQPVDVTGAGDTVIAAYTLGLACGLPALQAARIGNHAGGIVVMKKGTASATAAELIDSILTVVESDITDAVGQL